MAILKYLIPIIAATLLTGCYEEFTPGVDTTPVLCINSLITAGRPIDVDVSHTWLFSDQKSGASHKVTDAKVTIIVNGRVVGGDYIPEEGDNIRIVAESATYGSATAEVTVPRATPIGDVTVSPVDIYVWEDGISFNLNIEMDVNDPADVQNYYKFGYGISSEDAPLNIGNFEYDLEPIFKEHIGAFETVIDSGDESEFTFFSDCQFSGRKYTLHLNFTNNYFSMESDDFDESMFECGVDLYLTTVSSSYYYWAVNKWHLEETLISDMSDLGFADPKWGYSNVSTGAGVVAAQSSAVYKVNLKDFLQSIINNQ